MYYMKTKSDHIGVGTIEASQPHDHFAVLKLLTGPPSWGTSDRNWLNRSYKFIHEDYIHKVEGDNFQFQSKQLRIPISAYWLAIFCLRLY